jgi:hypothetical protein
MSFNNDGHSTIVQGTKNLFGYLAYGTGAVADNATSLVTEIDRMDSPIVEDFDNYFNLVFTLLENEGNGNLIKEYGLSTTDAGDIASTSVYAPIDKNNLIYLTIYIKVLFENK